MPGNSGVRGLRKCRKLRSLVVSLYFCVCVCVWLWVCVCVCGQYFMTMGNTKLLSNE